jgi:non-ribosomal peptide synthetase component F
LPRKLSPNETFPKGTLPENLSSQTPPPPGNIAPGAIAAILGGAKFDLTLEIAELDDGVTATFEYATDLFDSITIQRMLGHFLMLLEGVVANAEQRLSELPLLASAERQQLLIE